MITTTDYYKQHVLDNVTKWHPKIVIDYSDYNIDNTIAVSNTFDAVGSFPDQIADGIKTPSYKYFSWANFEWGCHLMGDDENYEHGAISQQISGADKTFPLNKPTFYGTTFYGTEPVSLMTDYTPRPTFSVTFAERQITDLEVVFDDKLNEYAEEFDVLIYQGSTLASTENVTGNTGTTWTKTLSSAIDDVTRMDLVINKWSLAGTWARVLEFYTSLQKTYLEDDILSMSTSEQSIAKMASTPIGNITANSCEISLVNINSFFDNDNEASPLQGNLIKNRRIMPYIGLEGDLDNVTGKQNYIQLGTYYSQQWTNDNYNMTAGCNGRDVIQLMAEAEFNESQFITEPADQNESYTTTADFAAFTKFNTVAANDSLSFGGDAFVYSAAAEPQFYSQQFYGSTIYAGTFYYGYATTSFSYTYTPGTSVKISLSATEIKQDSDIINYYLSFDGGSTYRQITDNITYYPSTESASQTVYIKIEIITSSLSSGATVQDVSLTIAGYVSLYSLARTIIKQFDDASGLIGENYTIADELGAISIPNAYLEPQTYKDALNLICEAGAARAYSDRDGGLVIERVDNVVTYDAARDADSYFLSVNSSNPQELVNRVTVTINPLTRASSDEEIATLSDTAAVGDTEYTIEFTTDPCDGVSFSIPESGVAVSSSTIYTWGADITVTNSNGSATDFNLTVSGRPYRVLGAYKVQLDDTESIRKSGVQELQIDNPLIQNESQATDIMTPLINSFKNQKRLIETDIVPDPSIEISDGVSIDNRGYKIYNNDIAYSETGLTQVISGVKQ